tara:strand:+ start:303 stop:521 length:219 start_codon:yes stop_codon:yes gene_type:complete
VFVELFGAFVEFFDKLLIGVFVEFFGELLETTLGAGKGAGAGGGRAGALGKLLGVAVFIGGVDTYSLSVTLK